MAIKAENLSTAMCSRCRENSIALIARNETMCTDCFVKYVSTKVVKRLEAFNRRHVVPGQQQSLLVPVSFGSSSIIMLHLLHRQIQWQVTRSRRAAYNLHILHVYDDRAADALDKGLDQLRILREQYPGHRYEAAPLSSVYGESKKTALGGITNNYSVLLNQIKSTSSRADLEYIMLRRVIVEFAQDKHLDGIFWGESTTKLAEKVLSESAKGRGYALPWSVSDGETPFGLLFYFPLRDVLKKEILQFVKFAHPVLTQVVTDDAILPPIPVSSKNMTIDILSRQYFDSVEANYPSIVSNVVRTSTKLEASVLGLRRCKLCQFPVTDEQLGHGSWQGLQHGSGSQTLAENSLCYGCSRTLPADLVSLLP